MLPCESARALRAMHHSHARALAHSAPCTIAMRERPCSLCRAQVKSNTRAPAHCRALCTMYNSHAGTPVKPVPCTPCESARALARTPRRAPLSGWNACAVCCLHHSCARTPAHSRALHAMRHSHAGARVQPIGAAHHSHARVSAQSCAPRAVHHSDMGAPVQFVPCTIRTPGRLRSRALRAGH